MKYAKIVNKSASLTDDWLQLWLVIYSVILII